MLVCTPCYGGVATVGYIRGMMSILDAGIDVNFLITEGESLVTRARNNLVATFLNTNYNTLAFIDADIEMTGEDLAKLIAISGVRGAAVNMKMPGHPECLSCFDGGKQWRRADMPAEPFAVDFLGAAVLLIDRCILEDLVSAYPEKAYVDPLVGEGSALFEQSIINNTYLSEDYGFCRLLKEQGIPVLCHPGVIVNHYGASVWRA